MDTVETNMKTWFDLEMSLAGSRIVDPVAEPRILWVDIETRKVPAPDGWAQKRRWAPFMVGIAGAADPGILFAEVRSGTEMEIVQWLREFTGYEFRYLATREFDEMVLRGRFTNARRAHATRPGPWPNLNRAKIAWKNIRQMAGPKIARVPDVASKMVPRAWDRGLQSLVAVHCLRDVLENVLRDSDVHLSARLRKQLLARFQ
jgi:hypothetical protein